MISYVDLKRYLVSCLIIFSLYLLVIIAIYKIKKKSNSFINKYLILGLFMIWVYIIIIVTILCRKKYINLETCFCFMPFDEIFDLIEDRSIAHLKKFIILFFINIALFIPYGFITPFLLKKRKILITFISGFSLVIIIELIQGMTKRGIFDINDIALNMIGITLGLLFYRLINKLLSKKKTQ